MSLSPLAYSQDNARFLALSGGLSPRRENGYDGY